MDNENDVAELLSLCGVCKTYHFESPMLHWYGDAKSLEKSRFLASFFFVKNGKFGYLLVTQILGIFFAPKYLWHPLDLHHRNSYSLQPVASYRRVMKP